MIKNKIISILVELIFFINLTILTSFSFAEEVNLSFDHFYDHAELTKALKKLARAYPKFMTLKSIGKSYQGRDIWAVILNNPETGPAEHKPGFYIDANIHGNEIQGTEVALYTIWYLLKNYGKNKLVTRLLDERSFYIVPTMNPDSRDYYINKASDPNSPRSGLMPYDDDKDGIADEDGPEDLNGDGSITLMRKKDSNGNYRTHPDDPRILIPVRPGEKGEYILLGEEGIDNDGDGKINEDGPGGYDMNRNYGYNWQPNYVQRGAGDYPFCFPETKAVRDFLMAHPNIAGAQNFHNYGAMILRGPGAKNMGEYPVADRKVYDYIAKKGEKILPSYKYVTVYKDMYTVYGGSIDFLYCSLGIFTFSNELDQDLFETLPFGKEEREEKEEDEEMRRLRFLVTRLNEMIYHDLVLLGEQYAEWKPFKHPLYGDIEIGGVKKFGRRVPPLFKLAETCHRNAAFCLFHADQLPRLSFDEVKIKKLRKDLYLIDFSIKNSKVIPTISTIAIQKKLHRADRFKIEGKNVKLLAAGQLIDRFRGVTREIRCYKNLFWIEKGIPGFRKIDFRILIKGKGKVTLIYDSLKGGLYKKSVELQ